MPELPKLHPAVAATRVAVRGALTEAHQHNVDEDGTPPPTQPLALVALSGGADSLALAAAVAFEAPKMGWHAGAIVVDHDLQDNSAEVAARAAEQARGLGLTPVIVRKVDVAAAARQAQGAGGSGGPEAAARAARYRALDDVRAETGALCVLTAHTRDDQAEQVLLALARGSGTRSVAGIPPWRGHVLRPFLQIDRETTVAACHAQHLEPWVDPHNTDPSFTRVRVRTRVLPVLEAELGPGVAANLARSAQLAREDADALDSIARELLVRILGTRQGEPGFTLEVAPLREAPAALRQRVIRFAAKNAFDSHLSSTHTLEIAKLVTNWRGQQAIHVPGATVTRQNGLLIFTPHV